METPAPPTRGRLKVFLGYAPGVGKTYAMLDSAQQLSEQGVDVVIGFIEPPVPKETATRMHGLELVPPLVLENGNSTCLEINVDATIARNPQVVLVDELAHVNCPNSRHQRRYQDIQDLLDNGITVYTTVNIQNLESLKDIVLQITGEDVVETVPDQFVDEADEIELIDLSTEELLKRLRDEPLTPNAVSRLTGLRELAMRKAAARVDNQLRDHLKNQAQPAGWMGEDQILACISSNAASEKLVRTAYRLAQETKTPWHVIHVEMPRSQPLSYMDQEQVLKTLDLAEKLGAQTHILRGDHLANTILDYARAHNATRILVGKPGNILPGSRSLVDQLLAQHPNLQVILLNTHPDTPSFSSFLHLNWHSSWVRYLGSTLLVGLITLAGLPLRVFIHPTNMVMLYMAVVVVSAVTIGRGPSLLASGLSVLAFDYFFVEPKLSLTVADSEYLITFFVFLSVALVISSLASMLREQVSTVKQRAAQTAALNALSRDLTTALNIQEVVKIIVAHIGQTLSREVVLLLPKEAILTQQMGSPEFELSPTEMEVARWAFEHGQPAGRGTSTHPDQITRFEPLKTSRGVLGILGIRPDDPFHWLTPVQRQLLDSFASLSALAIERAQLREEANQAQVLQAAEKLQTALLNSISHDLRTPLVSIQGVLDSLLEVETSGQSLPALDRVARLDMLENAREETLRLNRLVENLLDMSRLESGALRISFDEGDIQDVIGSALSHMSEALQANPVHVDLDPSIPLVMMDVVLIEQVLINLLDNAAKYSAPGAPIRVKVSQGTGQIEVQVSDRGIGIPAEDLERVFDKFYRVQHSQGLKGTGLGLSICKGIIEAHKGSIRAEANPEGGTILRFSIPIQQQGGTNE